jgi:hypothetical protein
MFQSSFCYETLAASSGDVGLLAGKIEATWRSQSMNTLTVNAEVFGQNHHQIRQPPDFFRFFSTWA